ncbi:MAG: hypothetical protein AB1772_03255 [Candidatus Zixiibacteriota bacterium]
MRYELKSIGIWSFVRVSFFVHLGFGFVIGLFYAAMLMMVFMAASTAPLDEFSELPFDIRTLGPIMMIILPFVFAVGGAVMGTLFGLVAVGFYNLVGRWMGGLEFEFREVGLVELARALPGAPGVDNRPVFAPPPPPPAGSTYTPPPPSQPAWNPPPPPTKPPPGNPPGNQ